MFFSIVLNKDANKNNFMNFSLWDLIRDMMVPGVGMVSPVMVRSPVQVDSCTIFFCSMLVRPERERFLLGVPFNLLFSSVVLAFRTLTTLLQYLPHRQSVTVEDTGMPVVETLQVNRSHDSGGISRYLLLLVLVEFDPAGGCVMLSYSGRAGSYSSADIMLHVCVR